MNTMLECIPCFVRQCSEALHLKEMPSSRREHILRHVLQAIAEADWGQAPPIIAQGLHRILRKEMADADPYAEIKERMNRLALDLLPACRLMLQETQSRREMLVRLIVAGNLLDAGAQNQIRPEELPDLLNTLQAKALVGECADLFQAAEQADRILYLADNAGEIIFDRLLIEALPMHKVTVAVRGHPILNDALREDARLAGLDGLVAVIENGSDAPGTWLDDCSEVFRDYFHRADLIISKGQGNYETLCGVPAPIFFLFTVKCHVVAAKIGAPIGTLIARKSDMWPPGHLGQAAVRS